MTTVNLLSGGNVQRIGSNQTPASQVPIHVPKSEVRWWNSPRADTVALTAVIILTSSIILAIIIGMVLTQLSLTQTIASTPSNSVASSQTSTVPRNATDIASQQTLTRTLLLDNLLKIRGAIAVGEPVTKVAAKLPQITGHLPAGITANLLVNELDKTHKNFQLSFVNTSIGYTYVYDSLKGAFTTIQSSADVENQ